MSGGTDIDLRCGRWQDVLADVACDVLITDPPYSARTHGGHDGGTAQVNRVREKRFQRLDRRTNTIYRDTTRDRRSIDYACWNDADVIAFVGSWSARVRGWIVACTDHTLVPVWESAFQAAGRYVFAPLQFMQPGSRVRLIGDGPSLWSVTIVVARPKTREFQHWGALPGGYVLPPSENVSNDLRRDNVVGAKPLWLMRALVRDYSRPGDIVCDPCAGGATTLLAAAIEGRRAVGSEMDPVTHAKAMKRIARGYTPTFDFAEGT